MDTLKAQTRYILDQLRTLSTSGRIAIALLVVLLLGGLYQMMSWAGQSEWRALLDQSFTPAQIQRIQAELSLVGAKTKVEGDRIFIRGDDDERQRFMAVLAQHGALPRDTSIGYDALIKNSNPFLSNQKERWLQGRGLEAELSAVLRKFQGVRDANVLIQVPEKRPFGSRAKSAASASVNVTLDDGDVLDQKRIDAIANLVAGAVEGLSPTDVNITDGSQIYRARDPQKGLAGDLLEKQRLEEDHYTRKIYDQFQRMVGPGLIANVRVKLRDVDEMMDDKVLGKPEPIRETEDVEESNSLASGAGPGVLPNQNRSINDGGSGNSTNRSKTSVEYGENVSTRVTRINKPAGFLDAVSASISVPHTYLEGVYRRQKAVTDDKPVEYAELQKVADIELKRIEEMTKTLLIGDEVAAGGGKNVVVDWYYDMPNTPAAATAAAAQAGSTDYVGLLRDFGPQAGLGLLAIGAFFFVLRIAKKAQASLGNVKVATAGAASSSTIGELPLGGAPVTVGQAEGIQSAMIGHEVDAGLVRTQQIVQQISDLVNEDADSAAGILQTWLAEDK